MRAVALANPAIQKQIITSFVAVKVVLPYPKTEPFSLDWPTMKPWRDGYAKLDGKGYTGCAIVSHDLAVQYAHTGSAMVWEMFDSTAYDAKKFQAMIGKGLQRAQAERRIRQATNTSAARKTLDLAALRAVTQRVVATEGLFQLPPKGSAPYTPSSCFESRAR